MSFIERAVKVKVLLEMLAPVVQTSKTSFYRLHQWCKQKKLLLDRCTVGSSISKNVLTIAWLPQDLSAGVILTSDSREG